MRVEVVYALPESCEAIALDVPPGTTASQAVEASRIAERHPGLDLSRLGIFGRRVAADAPLAEGDRVEIYRPLRRDAKQSRRERAKRSARR